MGNAYIGAILIQVTIICLVLTVTHSLRKKPILYIGKFWKYPYKCNFLAIGLSIIGKTYSELWDTLHYSPQKSEIIITPWRLFQMCYNEPQERSFQNMYNPLGLIVEDNSLTKQKNAKTMFSGFFLPCFFSSICHFGRIFEGLCNLTSVFDVFCSQAMLSSFKMSHEEACWDIISPFGSRIFKIYCLPLQYVKTTTAFLLKVWHNLSISTETHGLNGTTIK